MVRRPGIDDGQRLAGPLGVDHALLHLEHVVQGVIACKVLQLDHGYARFLKRVEVKSPKQCGFLYWVPSLDGGLRPSAGSFASESSHFSRSLQKTQHLFAKA